MAEFNNFYELLAARSAEAPARPFLYVDEQIISYGEMLAKINSLAEKITVQAGDWLVYGESFFEQLLLFFVLQKKGARPVILHHGLRDTEIEAIIAENNLAGRIDLVAGKLIVKESGLFPINHAENDILGVLTSGSTGTPKVLYRTYFSWAGFFPEQNKIFGVSRETKLFLQGSLSFTGNLNALLAALFEGAAVATSTKTVCGKWLEVIAKAKADVIYLVPAKLLMLARKSVAEVAFVKQIFTGSQLLTAADVHSLRRKFPQAELVLYYGASELNYITYRVLADDSADSANVGRPFAGVTVTVQDGFIYVDTPYHVSGVSLPFTLKDMGHFSSVGELIFAGREGDFINRGGLKINAIKTENAIKEIAGVAAVTVLKIMGRRGEEGAAFVVTEDGADKKILRRAIRKRLGVQAPKKIYFVEEIPLNDRGKVAKEKLLATLKNSAK